jgi:hypothetical protein
MADTVAIVSVVGSTLVGLSGIGAGVYGAWAGRRWQSREERATELRDVLDTAAANIAALMQPIALANVAFTTIDITQATGADEEKLLQQARTHLQTATAAQRDLWATTNRLRVRKGSESAVATTLKAAEKEIGLLGAIVQLRLVNPSVRGGYEEAWAKAEAAERAFYDASSAELEGATERSGEVVPDVTR